MWSLDRGSGRPPADAIILRFLGSLFSDHAPLGDRLKKPLSWLLGAIMSALALTVALWGIQPARLLQVAGDARLVLAIPAVALLILGLFARARSWHVLLRSQVSYRRVFWALNEGYLLNSVLPLRLGEFGRAYSTSRTPGVGAAQAFASVLVERLIDVAVSLAALTWSLTLIAAPAWTGQITTAAAMLLGAGVLGSALVVLSRRQILAWLRKLPFLRSIGLLRAVQGFTEGLSATGSARLLGRSAFWSALAWLTAWAQLAVVFAMFGLSGKAEVLVFVMGVTAFGAAIPSSPGAIGVFELSMVAAMLAVGFDREAAVGVAIVMHFLQLGTTGVLGAVALVSEGQSLIGLADRARQLLRETREGAAA